MHFEGKVLVEVSGNVATPHWRGRVPRPPPFNTKVVDSETPIEDIIEEWLEQYGRQWINEFTGSGSDVNCPKGTLVSGDVDPDVPTTATPDVWYCKVTGETCPIQALIPVDDEAAFINGCNIEGAAEELDRPPERYKKDLHQAVRDGKFTGEHHMMGRVGCWRCQQKRVREDLHDPWALTELHSHLDEETTERKITFRQAGIESWVGHPICAECFLELPDSFPGIEFSEWGLDFGRYRAVPYHLDFD